MRNQTRGQTKEGSTKPSRRTDESEVLKAEQVLAQQSAEKRDELFRRMFWESPIAIEICDAGGEYLAINRSCIEIFGLPKAEPRWQFNLFRDPHVPDDAKESLRSGASVRYEVLFDFDEARRRRLIKTTRSGVAHFDVLITPLGLARGQASGYLLQFQDVTDLKQAQAKLESYQHELKSLASQLSLAEERERRRLARGLHDEIGQTLALIKLKLGLLRERTPGSIDAGQLGEVVQLLEEAIERTRSLTFDLSPPVLYELGLVPALEWLIEQWQTRTGISCLLEDDRQPKLLPDDLKGLLFNAVRELLANVSKHSRAQTAAVSIAAREKCIEIRVRDDGIGFSITDTPWKAKGFGLFSIRERLTALGGSVAVESDVGQGTSVILVVPMRDDEQSAGEGLK